MFICDGCNKSIGPRKKPVKVIVEKRRVEYFKKDGTPVIGWEIVREVKACKDCINHDVNNYGLLVNFNYDNPYVDAVPVVKIRKTSSRQQRIDDANRAFSRAN